jgi:hypothetical protein
MNEWFVSVTTESWHWPRFAGNARSSPLIERYTHGCYRGSVLAGPISGTLPAAENSLPVPAFFLIGCWNVRVKLQIAYQSNQRRYWT